MEVHLNKYSQDNKLFSDFWNVICNHLMTQERGTTEYLFGSARLTPTHRLRMLTGTEPPWTFFLVKKLQEISSMESLSHANI